MLTSFMLEAGSRGGQGSGVGKGRGCGRREAELLFRKRGGGGAWQSLSTVPDSSWSGVGERKRKTTAVTDDCISVKVRICIHA